MSHRRPITVGVDGSRESAAALRWAAHQAVRWDTGLVLAHSYGTPIVFAAEDLWLLPWTRERGAQLLTAAVAQLAPVPVRSVETCLSAADPATLLTDLAHDSALVAVGRDRSAWAARLLRGRVVTRLDRWLPCPLAVVPWSWGGTTPNQRRVVAAVDGETDASAVLGFAVQEAEQLGARLVVLTVGQAPEHGAGHRHEHAGSRQPGQEEADPEATLRNLAELTAGLRAEHPECRVELRCVQGRPTSAVADAGHGALRVVVGRPHHSSGRLSWATSVAHELLRDSPAPLIVMPFSEQPERRERRRPLLAPTEWRPEGLLTLEPGRRTTLTGRQLRSS